MTTVQNKTLNIVKVRYENQGTNGTVFSGREYTYFSIDELKVGDIVTVPVRDTTGKAQVTAINVPESEIAAFKDKVKIIPSKSELVEDPVEETPAETLPAIDIATDKMDVAIININPGDNPAVLSLREEIIKLSNYSISRVIKCDEDVSPITDDLAIISKLKKAIKEKQDEYVSPIKSHLEKVQFVFKDLLACLDDIDKTNREKITAYRNEQLRRQQQAEELNRQALELAKKQAEFSGTGEITVDLTPIEAAPVLKKVSTDLGSVSTIKVRHYRIIDLSLLPREYMSPNIALITKVVKAGIPEIPGVEIYEEDSLRVNTR